MSTLDERLAALQTDLAVATDPDIRAALQAAIAEIEASISDLALAEARLDAANASLAAASATATEAQRLAALNAQLDELKRAYRSGARRLQYEGKSVEWGSPDELRAAIASLEADLGIARTGAVVIRSHKGW